MGGRPVISSRNQHLCRLRSHPFRWHLLKFELDWPRIHARNSVGHFVPYSERVILALAGQKDEQRVRVAVHHFGAPVFPALNCAQSLHSDAEISRSI